MNQSLKTLSFDPKDLITQDLLELLGVSDMNEQERSKLLAAVYDTIQTRIVVRLLNQLNQEQIDELEKNLAGGNDKKVEELLEKNNLPSLQQLAAEEALLYKVELVNELS